MAEYERDYNPSPNHRAERENSPARSPPARSPIRKRKYEERESRGPKKERNTSSALLKILVPNYAAGAIIGKRGATMRELEERFSCKIKISPSGKLYPGLGERVCVLEGDVNQIVELNANIMEKVNSDAKHAGDSGRSQIVKIIVPNLTAGLIIGKGGETIKGIQTDTGAKVIVNSQQDCPVRGERVVSVSGTLEQRADACREVITRVAPDPGNIKQNGNVHYDDDGGDRRDQRDNHRDDYRSGGGSGGLPDGFGQPGGLSSILGGPSPGLLAGLGQQQNPFGALGGGSSGIGQLGLGAGLQDMSQRPRSSIKTTAQINIEIPDMIIKAMFLKGRKVLEEIMQFSGAKIQFQNTSNDFRGSAEVLSIYGDLNQVQIAHYLVNQKIQQAENDLGGR